MTLKSGYCITALDVDVGCLPFPLRLPLRVFLSEDTDPYVLDPLCPLYPLCPPCPLCQPSTIRQHKSAKVRTPLQLYIRHLFTERLQDDPDVVDGVIKQLRKLPWQVREDIRTDKDIYQSTSVGCISRLQCLAAPGYR